MAASPLSLTTSDVVALERRLSTIEAQLEHTAMALDKLTARIETALSDELTRLRLEVAVIKTKAAVYGTVGGAILGALISLAVGLLS